MSAVATSHASRQTTAFTHSVDAGLGECKDNNKNNDYKRSMQMLRGCNQLPD